MFGGHHTSLFTNLPVVAQLHSVFIFTSQVPGLGRVWFNIIYTYFIYFYLCIIFCLFNVHFILVSILFVCSVLA